jgi:hypothetical protein
METNSVLCQVRSAILCTCNVFILLVDSLCHGSDDYLQPFATETRVRSQTSPVVRFIMDTVALGHVQHFSPLSIIPPLLLGHCHRQVGLSIKIKSRNLWTFTKSKTDSHIGSAGQRSALTL